MKIFANGRNIKRLMGARWSDTNFDLLKLANQFVQERNNPSLLNALQGVEVVHYVYKTSEEWRKVTGELHREDGPARIEKNGDFRYLINNLWHRIDGPAIRIDQQLLWYVNGEWVSGLVLELISKSPFDESVHLGILSEYWAERGDFRLLDVVQPYLVEKS